MEGQPDSTASLASSIAATLTTFAATAAATATLSLNSTTDSSPFLQGGLVDETPAIINDGNPVVNFILGFLIVIGASIMNAFGLNLTKLDHTRNAALPKASRKQDWQRPLWLAGMAAYIASQLFGSTLSLKYLRSEWVAPLGSTSLIFNFLFAKWLVGTPVAKEDIRGTALIVFSVILILVFSSINHGLDGSITLARLTTFWRRGRWLSWFFFVAAATATVYLSTHLLHELLRSRASLSPTVPEFDPDAPLGFGGRRNRSSSMPSFIHTLRSRRRALETQALSRLDRLLASTDDSRIRFLEGIGWAVVGGSLAGGCLVFTKAVVKLLSQPGHPFASFAAMVTLLMVGVTAVMQIICLNRALKAADSTLVVPLFYAGYTIFGFVNTLIFLNETGQYENWVLVAIFLSIGILVAGVVLLSMKQTDESNGGGGPTVTVQDPAMRLNPLPSTTRSSGEPRERSSINNNVSSSSPTAAFKVGDDSDDDDDDEKDHGRGDQEQEEEEEKATRGVGGLKGKSGERGGLLFDGDDYEREPETPLRVGGDGDEGDPFGDFEEAPPKGAARQKTKKKDQGSSKRV